MSRAPNIVILCPDEMKATALGCYGNRAGATPFIDSWAQSCAQFDQCHTVHPKCTPSRAAFVTAQYPHVGGHRTLDLPVRAHEVNLIRTLREAGYETVLGGKNHTVEQALLPETFTQVLPRGGKNDFEPKSGSGFPVGSYYIGESTVPLDGLGDRIVTRGALDWIAHRPADAPPFLLWLNWNAPHPPYSIPAPYFGSVDRAKVSLPGSDDPAQKPPYHRQLQQSYDCGPDKMSEAKWREVAGIYLDMCRFVDDQIKAIVTGLHDAGLSENTLVVLWSDHGDFAGEHRLPEKWDTAFYDCITRVPLLIAGPGIPTGRIGALVETIDILPTIFAAAGVAAPPGIQGKDLGQLMRREVAELRREVFCQGGQEDALLARTVSPEAKPRPAAAYALKQAALFADPTINRRAKMIRDHAFKYVYHSGGFEEFYDLTRDPHELENLARRPAPPEKLANYRLRLMQKLIEAETMLPHQDYLEA